MLISLQRAGSGNARASSSFLDSITITTPWVLAVIGTAGALLVIGLVTLLVVACWPQRRSPDYPKGALAGKVCSSSATVHDHAIVVHVSSFIGCLVTLLVVAC